MKSIYDQARGFEFYEDTAFVIHLSSNQVMALGLIHGELNLFNAKSGSLIEACSLNKYKVTKLIFSETKRRWNHITAIKSFSWGEAFNDHTSPITALSLSKDQKILLSGDNSGTVILKNLTDKLRKALKIILKKILL